MSIIETEPSAAQDQGDAVRRFEFAWKVDEARLLLAAMRAQTQDIREFLVHSRKTIELSRALLEEM